MGQVTETQTIRFQTAGITTALHMQTDRWARYFSRVLKPFAVNGNVELSIHLSIQRQRSFQINGAERIGSFGGIQMWRNGTQGWMFTWPQGRAMAWCDGEQKRFEAYGRRGGWQWQAQAIVLPLLLRVIKAGGLGVHAAGMVVHDQGWLFVGSSGSGKSTLASLGANHTVVGDECIFLKKRAGRWWMFGVPPWWRQVGKPIAARVDRICFIEHGVQNALTKLKVAEALLRLWQESYHGFFLDRGMMQQRLTRWAELVESIPSYRLAFLPTKKIWDFLAEEASCE